MAAWLIMRLPLRKQTYQTKWCYNFITGAHEYLSSTTSLGSCERSKVRIGWAWWDPDRMSDERAHVDLLNLTKAMKWRSPGERCLLMHTVWTADLVSVCSGTPGCRTRLFGAHHSANDTSLRALLWWPETQMTWVVSARQESVWHLWETGRGWAACLCCYTVPCHSKGPI